MTGPIEVQQMQVPIMQLLLTLTWKVWNNVVQNNKANPCEPSQLSSYFRCEPNQGINFSFSKA